MARRSLERYRRQIEKQQAEGFTTEDGQPPKKKMSDQTKVLIGALALLLACVVLLIVHLTIQEEEKEVETKIQTAIGETGRQSLTFKMKRVEGIVNLPVAQEATDLPRAGGVEIELRYAWKDDPDLAKRELKKQFIAAAASLTKSDDSATYDQPIILKADRDLEYRFIGQAFFVGAGQGFVNFHIACLKKGTGEDVGYLKVILPPPGLRTFLFRMHRQGDHITYVFGKGAVQKLDSLWDATEYLKAAHERKPDMVVEIAPTESVTIQHFVEGLNSVTAAGFKKIVLGYTEGLQ